MRSDSDSLLESEFFGHEKGAVHRREGPPDGLLEFADKGTFFLFDELGELPMLLQAKLLRSLSRESAKIRRVGGREEIGINMHIVAATAQGTWTK